ncbi:MAG: MraY family glycosyltransferase, partial [Pseudomonadota bacterium]
MFASAHSSLIIIVAETIAALLSFALCLAAVRMRFGLNEVVGRSNHKVPTPRTGGLMALIALFGASALLGATGLIDREVALLLGVTALAGVLGVADDFLNLPAIPKLLGQIVIACTLTFLLGPEQELPLPFLGWIELPSVVAYVLTILWIVGIMNVINFMDGLNGLVGSVTLLVLLAAGFLAPNAQALLMVTCAAIVGFLAVNVFWGR